MIDFQPIHPEDLEKYNPFLHSGKSRGCEYSFANLYLWGRQKAAVVEGQMVMFSQFDRKTVYPYPAGEGEVKPVLEAIIRLPGAGHSLPHYRPGQRGYCGDGKDVPGTVQLPLRPGFL